MLPPVVLQFVRESEKYCISKADLAIISIILLSLVRTENMSWVT